MILVDQVFPEESHLLGLAALQHVVPGVAFHTVDLFSILPLAYRPTPQLVLLARSEKLSTKILFQRREYTQSCLKVQLWIHLEQECSKKQCRFGLKFR